MLQCPAEAGEAFMREIGSHSRLIIFFYAAGIFAIIFVLNALGFSSNAVIAVTVSWLSAERR
jgi:hypothetical protein